MRSMYKAALAGTLRTNPTEGRLATLILYSSTIVPICLYWVDYQGAQRQLLKYGYNNDLIVPAETIPPRVRLSTSINDVMKPIRLKDCPRGGWFVIRNALTGALCLH